MNLFAILSISSVVAFLSASYATRRYGMGKTIGLLVFILSFVLLDKMVFEKSNAEPKKYAEGIYELFVPELVSALEIKNSALLDEMELYYNEYRAGKITQKDVYTLFGYELSTFFFERADHAPSHIFASYYALLMEELRQCANEDTCSCYSVLSNRKFPGDGFLVYENDDYMSRYQLAIADIVMASNSSEYDAVSRDTYEAALRSVQRDANSDFGQYAESFILCVISDFRNTTNELTCTPFFLLDKAIENEPDKFKEMVKKAFVTVEPKKI